MKTTRLHIYIVGLLFAAFVGGSKAYAQFEIDPDHFDSPDTQSLPKSKSSAIGQATKVHFEGKVTLPYSVQCDGRSLGSGKYLVSFDSDGRMAHVTLHRGGHADRFQAIAQQRDQLTENALVVERNGGLPQLSMIQAGHLDLMFHGKFERTSGLAPRNFQKLSLISVRPTE